MSQNKFPPGWDEERVKAVLTHYDEQSEEEAVAEDEAVYEEPNQIEKQPMLFRNIADWLVPDGFFLRGVRCRVA